MLCMQPPQMQGGKEVGSVSSVVEVVIEQPSSVSVALKDIIEIMNARRTVYGEGSGKWSKKQKKAYNREYYQKNREKLLQKANSDYAINRVAIKNRRRAWREKNPDKVATYNRRQREKDRALYQQRRASVRGGG